MRLSPDKYLHSREHLLADDLSRMMGEPKKFGAYLGISVLYYESDLRGLARRVLEKRDLPAEAKGKYFFAALKGLAKKPGIKFKRQKKKRKENMAKILDIVQEPNKTLRAPAHDISVSDIRSPAIQKLINNMKKTLASTPNGVGLAAPQVGKSLRIFIVSEEAEEIDRTYRVREGKKPYETRKWNYYAFINPTIINTARKKLEDTEGCLSVRGKYGTVKRNEKITVRAYDENGKKFTRGASRFFARVIQHELDHLDGVLFIDKAEKLAEKTSDEAN